jgi:hypothetical protein
MYKCTYQSYNNKHNYGQVIDKNACRKSYIAKVYPWYVPVKVKMCGLLEHFNKEVASNAQRNKYAAGGEPVTLSWQPRAYKGVHNQSAERNGYYQ